MQNSTYNQLAAVTLSDKFHATETAEQQLLHAAIGIQTEMGELFAAIQRGKQAFFLFDKVNFLEEIGDAVWYLSIPQRIFGFDITEHDTSNNVRLVYKGMVTDFDERMFNLNQNTTEFLDIMKKSVYYGRQLEKSTLRTLLGCIYSDLRTLVHMVGGNWDNVLKNNIDKLAARYEGKFSEVLANNRDLAKEYTILARK